MTLSIRARFILCFVGAAILTSGGTVLFLNRWIGLRAEEEVDARLSTLSRVVSHLHKTSSQERARRFHTLATEPRLRALAQVQDPETLRRSADELRTELKCGAIAFLTTDGTVIAWSGAGRDVAPKASALIPAGNAALEFHVLPIDERVLLLTAVVIDADVLQTYGGVLQVPIALQLGGRVLAATPGVGTGFRTSDVPLGNDLLFRIFVDTREVNKPLQEAQRATQVVALIAVVLSMLLAVIMAGRLTRPIHSLTAAAQRIAGGDLALRAREVGAPELKLLASAFNRLVEDLLKQGADKLRAEEQLRQVQKMEAIGKLAGGIAHDFNNLLMVVQGYADLLIAELTDPGLKMQAEEIRKAAERATGLTRQLLAFSRRQPLQPRVVDVNERMEHLSKMLRRLVGEQIELTLEPAPRPAHIKVDPTQLEQVIMNLTINARDAMPRGGTLKIRTSEVGEQVLIDVADTGTGIPVAVQSRIFEPFFTTKEQGKGTGLGLATVYGIVRQSGGDIRFESVEGKGTTFKIQFPKAQGGTSAALPSVPAAPKGGGETVLLAEDEPSVRSLLARQLRDAGYEVLEASDGVEALDVARRTPKGIRMLVSDIVMPRLNGKDLCDTLQQERPELKVILMSGYHEIPGVDPEAAGNRFAYLNKPVLGDTLLRKVREVLDAK